MILISMVFVFAGIAIAAEPYRIGLVCGATGRLSFIGQPEMEGVMLVAEQINKQGGINGHPIEVVFYDDENLEMKTVTFVKKLTQKDKVLAILGPSTSGGTFASVPISEEAKTPHISFCGSYSFVYPMDQRRYIFAGTLGIDDQIEIPYWYLKFKGIHKIATITVSNPFGDTGLEAMERLAPYHGMKIVKQEKFKQEDTDITPQLTRIKASEAEAIMAWCAGPTMIILTKNWHQLGMKQPLFSDMANASDFFMKAAGFSFEGRRMVMTKAKVAETLPDEDPIKAEALKFKQIYESKYHKEADQFALVGASMMQVLVEALKKSGPDRDKLRDELEKIHSQPTPVCIMDTSPHDHIIIGGGGNCLGTLKNGKWIYLPPSEW